MERRNLVQQRAGVRIEAREDGQQVVVGYASVFYNAADPGTEYELWPAYGTWPRVVERILPGAFDGRLADDVRGLFNHDPNWLLGRNKAGTMKLAVDEIGLRYEITPADTQAARDVLEHIRRGDLTGSSFSFSVGEQRWTEGADLEVREIVKVDGLYDVGPVTFPAYTATSTGVRSDAVAARRRDGSQDEAVAAYEAWRKHRAAGRADVILIRARAADFTLD